MLLAEKLKESTAYLIQDLVLSKIILLSVSQKKKTGTDSSMIFSVLKNRFYYRFNRIIFF